jgi:NADH:ubiquinone oxidoreductase subunit 3 (subunit A)
LPAKEFLPVGVFIVIGILFVIVSLLMSWLVRPHRPSKVKQSTYECGEIPIGDAWIQFRVGYYIYALIFLIFDVESMFIFPWAASMLGYSRNTGLAVLAFVDMLIFVALLAVGLAYAWKKGVLQWK